MRTSLFLVLGALLFGGCQLVGLDGRGNRTVETDYGETFRLREGGTATFPDEDVLFIHAVNDSRCPLRAQCVWAGEVEIVANFGNPNIRSAPDTLRGFVPHDGGAFADTLAGHPITIFRVDPYPQGGERDVRQVVTMKVEPR